MPRLSSSSSTTRMRAAEADGLAGIAESAEDGSAGERKERIRGVDGHRISADGERSGDVEGRAGGTGRADPQRARDAQGRAACDADATCRNHEASKIQHPAH